MIATIPIVVVMPWTTFDSTLPAAVMSPYVAMTP